MKKDALLPLFFFFVSSHALGHSNLEVSGQMDAAASVWNLPTGDRGRSAFSISTLFLNIATALKDNNRLVLQFEGSEEKTSSTERFDVKVREAYLDLVSIFSDMRVVRAGLIPQVWQEAQYETWSYRFLGINAWGLTEKWKYQSYSDLGISCMQELPWDLGEAALTISNGEGPREKEAGPHKEVSLFARLNRWKPWTFSLNYARGNYDRYGEDVSLKERVQGLMTYRREKWSTGLELLATRDPAEAIRDFGMAEGVNTLQFSGSALSGQAVSLFTTLSTGPQAEVMVRYDYLNAAVGEEGKSLQMGLIALNYLLSEDIRTAILIDYTRYAEDFAPGLRDRSKLGLAMQVLF